MLALIIYTIITLGSMPAAFDMARARNRSAHAWLNWAMVVGPLALVALLILGSKKRTAPAR